MTTAAATTSAARKVLANESASRVILPIPFLPLSFDSPPRPPPLLDASSLHSVSQLLLDRYRAGKNGRRMEFAVDFVSFGCESRCWVRTSLSPLLPDPIRHRLLLQLGKERERNGEVPYILLVPPNP